MGVTISYRRSLADLDRIEDFEDRVLDLALELGGEAQIWRTAGAKKGTVPICAKHPPGRSGKWGLSPFSRCARWLGPPSIRRCAEMIREPNCVSSARVSR